VNVSAEELKIMMRDDIAKKVIKHFKVK